MISPHINDLKQDFHTLKLICNTLNRSRSLDKFTLANHTNSTYECEISDDRIENCESPNFQVWSVSQGLPVPLPGLPPHSWLNQYTAPPLSVAAGFKVSQPPTLWLKRILIFSWNSFLESRPFPLFYADCRKISQWSLPVLPGKTHCIDQNSPPWHLCTSLMQSCKQFFKVQKANKENTSLLLLSETVFLFASF